MILSVDCQEKMDTTTWNLSYLNFRYSAKKRFFPMVVYEVHRSGASASVEMLIDQALRPAIRDALGKWYSESVENQEISARELSSTTRFKAARWPWLLSHPSIILKVEEQLDGSSGRIEIGQHNASIFAAESLYRAIRSIPGLEVDRNMKYRTPT